MTELTNQKQELADGLLSCEEMLRLGPLCNVQATMLLKWDGKLYAMCPYHGKHSVFNRRAEIVAEEHTVKVELSYPQFRAYQSLLKQLKLRDSHIQHLTQKQAAALRDGVMKTKYEGTRGYITWNATIDRLTAALDIFERDRNILKRIDRPGNTEFDT